MEWQIIFTLGYLAGWFGRGIINIIINKMKGGNKTKCLKN